MLKDYQELTTVSDLIRYAITQFNKAQLSFGHGSDNAWDEAVYLVLQQLHLPLDRLEPFYNTHVLREEKEQILNLIHQRVQQQIPLAYLLGEAWLQGHRFSVNNKVIVPRSPISELITQELTPWVEDPNDTLRILDLCTGSGCLAILAALYFPNSIVDGVDISDDAIELSQKNVGDYELENRVQIIQSDLFEELDPNDPYDLIICNPPYVNQQSMDNLPHEYKSEPPLALAGGIDGMDLVRKILLKAAEFLTSPGFIILEIGHEIENFSHAFPELEPIWLETENSDDQILLLQRDQLLEFKNDQS